MLMSPKGRITMERNNETKELDRLTTLALGKVAHVVDMIGADEESGVLLPAAEELLADVRRSRQAAGLEADPN